MRHVAACFALNGFLVSSLYARLPAVKDRLDLSPGELSLALLGLTAGLLLAQPLTGALIARRGSAVATIAGAAGCSLLVVAPALAGSLAALVAACVALGYANGTLDVAMNVQGVAAERELGRPILGRLHALFSVGVLAASALAVVLTPLSALAAVAAVGLVVTAAVAPGLRRGGERAGGPALARPTRALAGLGAIAFAALLCEGAVADWSAVHLRETLGAAPSAAPLGLAAFSLTMIAGPEHRASTDCRNDAVGGGLAAAGLALAAATTAVPAAVAGFALAGAGLAALFPLVVRAAGGAAAIAAVSATGYAGLVAGPPLVGGLADATSLRTALALVLPALAACVVVLGRNVR